jgi:predicted short-subunit dehydrogenase-like oxidoreductase (DUF2520 family)
MSRRIALIGPGRIGQAVTRLLHDAGHDIVAVIGRDPARAKAAARFIGRGEAATTDQGAVSAADLVLFALPDDLIGATAAHLRRSGRLTEGTVLVHFSGLHPANILLGEEGPALGALSIHPLQTFADAVVGVRNLPGTPCAIEGEAALLPLAEALVADLGGRPFVIDRQHKPLYHAAACVASNYLVALTNAACELLGGCGYRREEAFELLSPLLRGTLNNLVTLGPVAALTGPISRGDTHTVVRHLQALEPFSADLNALYRALGRQTATVAREKGTLDSAAEAKLRSLLEP